MVGGAGRKAAAMSTPGDPRVILLPVEGKQAAVDLLAGAATDPLVSRIAVLAVAWFGGTPEAADQAYEWAEASPVLAGEPNARG